MRNVLIAVGIARTILGSDERIEQQRRSLRELGIGFFQKLFNPTAPSLEEIQHQSLTQHSNARSCSRGPPLTSMDSKYSNNQPILLQTSSRRGKS